MIGPVVHSGKSSTCSTARSTKGWPASQQSRKSHTHIRADAEPPQRASVRRSYESAPGIGQSVPKRPTGMASIGLSSPRGRGPRHLADRQGSGLDQHDKVVGFTRPAHLRAGTCGPPVVVALAAIKLVACPALPPRPATERARATPARRRSLPSASSRACQGRRARLAR